MSAISDGQRQGLRAWASQKPQIRRVLLFGSRVKGTHHPNSDLDIAIDIEAAEDSNSTLANWMHWSDVWRTEIETVVPFKIDIQWLDSFGSTKEVEKGISEASEVVYERAS